MLKIACIFLILRIVVAGGEAHYNVTSITSPILQEHLFDTYLYHEVWTTVHYVEINDLKDQSRRLGNDINVLFDSCKKYKYCFHEASLKALQARFEQTESKINILFSLSGQRKKRGLINGIGSIMKFLNGTMSSDDAERINAEINDVYSNIPKSLKNQTTIIKNTIGQFTKVLSDRQKIMDFLTVSVKDGNIRINANSFNGKLMEFIVETEVEVDRLMEAIDLVL